VKTLEQLTAALLYAGINPDGYGERIGETREEHVARILRESRPHLEGCRCPECDPDYNDPRNFDALDFVPSQDGVRETLEGI
jgi:hypothetical protein